METQSLDSARIGQREVGSLVAEDYRRGAVLKRFGIDFCCGGKRTLATACERAGLDLHDVVRELDASDRRGQSGAPDRATQWEPGFLADYIVNEHHQYVRESLPVLRAFTQKVAMRHGDTRPELIAIAERFAAVAAELEAHMLSEEQVVFPHIKALAAGRDVPPQSLHDLLVGMEEEHDAAGTLMREIRALSRDYVPPAGACNTYRATFAKLEEFEDDLHRHVHLENNVLFPKALALDTHRAEAGVA